MFNIAQEPQTGTTIVACVFTDGVVVGCDTRMTIGKYVQNRACEKIVPLYDNVFLCRSGSAADCQIVADYVHHYVEQHAITTGSRPGVKLVANLVKLIIYRNKHLIAATLVAGWDEQHGGQVYGVTIGGTLMSEQWLVDGSGSTYIWGICDETFKENMTQNEAQEFAVSALSLAMTRDSSSGGLVRLVTITSTGAERSLIRDLPVYPEELQLPAVDVVMLDG